MIKNPLRTHSKYAIAAASVAALLAATAFAAGPDRGGPRHEGRHTGMHMDGGPLMGGMGMHPRMLDRMADELSLSDAQRQTIQGLFESARPAMQAHREQMKKSADALRDLDPGSKDYQAAVERASRTAGELASRAVSDGAQLRAQVWAVLTPDQRVKANEMREKMRERMVQRMQERGKGGRYRQGKPEAPAAP